MKKQYTKGVITVFMSLLSVILIAFLCTIIESVRVQGARAQTANITEMGNYSVFGEYEKKLLEDYEVFAVDGAYGTAEFSKDKVRDRLQIHLSANANPSADGITGLCFDPWKVSAAGSEIKEYALLTDRSGEQFYRQAVAYMKETAVTGMIGKLMEFHRDSDTAKTNQERYQRESEASHEEMQRKEQAESEARAELEKREADGGSGADGRGESSPDGAVIGETLPVTGEEGKPPGEEIEKKNPLLKLALLALRSQRKLVCTKHEMSSKSVWRSRLYSGRSMQRGTMQLDGDSTGIVGQLLFREYCLDRFPTWQDADAKKALSYQIEYLIGGKRSDAGNMDSVVGRLLLLREGMNYVHCLDDPQKDGAVTGLATLLFSWLPAVIPVVKHALLIGWSYGESLMDVKTLMDGGKVPFLKSADEWILSLDHLGEVGELLKQDQSGRQDGLSYRDYLRILLHMGSITTQRMRALDLVELNIRQEDGLSNFRADHCLVGMKEETKWTIAPAFSRAGAAFLGTRAPALQVSVESGFAYD